MKNDTCKKNGGEMPLLPSSTPVEEKSSQQVEAEIELSQCPSQELKTGDIICISGEQQLIVLKNGVLTAQPLVHDPKQEEDWDYMPVPAIDKQFSITLEMQKNLIFNKTRKKKNSCFFNNNTKSRQGGKWKVIF